LYKESAEIFDMLEALPIPDVQRILEAFKKIRIFKGLESTSKSY
jgi:hypothetical protein